MTNVTVIDHPVIQTKLAELRDFTADHRKFRSLLDEIAMLMTYEVTRDWPTQNKPVQTPLERTTGRVLARQVTLVPILRAGLGMADGVLRLLPHPPPPAPRRAPSPRPPRPLRRLPRRGHPPPRLLLQKTPARRRVHRGPADRPDARHRRQRARGGGFPEGRWRHVDAPRLPRRRPRGHPGAARALP